MQVFLNVNIFHNKFFNVKKWEVNGLTQTLDCNSNASCRDL